MQVPASRASSLVSVSPPFFVLDTSKRTFVCGLILVRSSAAPVLRCVWSCPLFAHGTRLLGAISLVIPLYRFSEDIAMKVLPAIQRSAAALTADLGGVWPFPPAGGQR
jgi:DNA-binding IclR family transcriptional regulator